jgi:hypothetical protein
MPCFAEGVVSETIRESYRRECTADRTAPSKETLYAMASDGEEQTRKIRFERVTYSILAQSTQ